MESAERHPVSDGNKKQTNETVAPPAQDTSKTATQAQADAANTAVGMAANRTVEPIESRIERVRGALTECYAKKASVITAHGGMAYLTKQGAKSHGRVSIAPCAVSHTSEDAGGSEIFFIGGGSVKVEESLSTVNEAIAQGMMLAAHTRYSSAVLERIGELNERLAFLEREKDAESPV